MYLCEKMGVTPKLSTYPRFFLSSNHYHSVRKVMGKFLINRRRAISVNI